MPPHIHYRGLLARDTGHPLKGAFSSGLFLSARSTRPLWTTTHLLDIAFLLWKPHVGGKYRGPPYFSPEGRMWHYSDAATLLLGKKLLAWKSPLGLMSHTSQNWFSRPRTRHRPNATSHPRTSRKTCHNLHRCNKLPLKGNLAFPRDCMHRAKESPCF